MQADAKRGTLPRRFLNWASYMKKVLMLILAVFFSCAAIWFVLWVFSSASLASQFCENNFSLFHGEFRCRQPHLGLIGSLISIVAGGLCVWLAFKKNRVDSLKS